MKPSFFIFLFRHSLAGGDSDTQIEDVISVANIVPVIAPGNSSTPSCRPREFSFFFFSSVHAAARGFSPYPNY